MCREVSKAMPRYYQRKQVPTQSAWTYRQNIMIPTLSFIFFSLHFFIPGSHIDCCNVSKLRPSACERGQVRRWRHGQGQGCYRQEVARLWGKQNGRQQPTISAIDPVSTQDQCTDEHSRCYWRTLTLLVEGDKRTTPKQRQRGNCQCCFISHAGFTQ